MIRYLSILAFLLIPVLSYGQEYIAEVLESTESFQMKSVSSGTFRVHYKVKINKESATSLGRIAIYVDSDKSLSSFSGSITDPSGKLYRKLKKQDLDIKALSEEMADDNFVYYYRPVLQVPYIVEYDYELTYKRGVPAFPAFFPVTSPDVKLAKGEFSVDVPAGTAIQYSSSMEPEIKKDGLRDKYVWSVSDFAGFSAESFMPPATELVPYVYASPVKFMFSKVEGNQGSWTDIGLWLYDLQKDTWDLSDEDKAKVRNMTSSCGSTFEKVKVLYDYLRQTTRYVSIQLGIGGYKPFNASTVSRTGFGDCKALSNYLKVMLEAAGVDSYYYILNTNRANLEKGYSSVGMMNHAMLAVPLAGSTPEQKDTLWVECTNPSLPLGYRHYDVAGHQVVLVTETGGQMIRCGRYADSLSRLQNKVRVLVNAVGDAFVDVQENALLDFTESRIRFQSLSEKEKSDRLASAIAVSSNTPKIKNIRDNFGDYPKYGKSYVPETKIDYSFESSSYAERNGERLFVPVTPLKTEVNWKRGVRKNDIYIESGYTKLDSVEIAVPPSYELEGLPKPVNIDCGWVSLSSVLKANDNKVMVVMKVEYKAGRYPKEKYAEFSAAARKFNNLVSSKIVFRKKQD